MSRIRLGLVIGISLLLVGAGCFGNNNIGARLPDPTSTARPVLTNTPLNDVRVIPDADRPNIIFILTDDLDAELGTTNYMPYYQELLVEQGTRVENFLISTSLCCPSRTTYLRGQYAHNHGIFTNNSPNGGFEKFYLQGLETSTLATWLQAAGYETYFIGKYLNGYPFREDRAYVPIGWTEWYSPAKGKPYTGSNYTLNENGVQVDYYEGGQEESRYLTDVISNKTVDMIRRSADKPVPFFIFLSTFAPHFPATPATRHADLFPGLTAPRSSSFNEQDVSDKPVEIQFDPMLSEDQISALDEHYRLRVQSMQAVDEMLGQLINVLEETGQLENTYIIFTSDNGFHMGQHRLTAGKGMFYEEDIHVPFVIRGPGIQAGAALEGFLTGNVDLAPTIAELAGVIPPMYVDGRSMVDLFQEQERFPIDQWRSAYLLEIYGKDTDDEDPNGPLILLKNFGLRTQDYLYVEYEDGFVELYHMNIDPGQLVNIAGSADPELLARLSAQLHALLECSGSTCQMVDRDIWK